MAKRVTPRTSSTSPKPRRAKSRPKKASGSELSAAVVASVRSDPSRPQAAAVVALEKAMESMRRGDLTGAAKQFEALLSDYPREHALLDCSRVYLERCRRDSQNESAPETLEERMTAATAALNSDDDARAESLAKGILAEEPEHDLALYLLAAVDARRGRPEAALAYLGQAIGACPEAAAQARLDSDFEGLRESAQFQQLTNLRQGLPGKNGPSSRRRS